MKYLLDGREVNVESFEYEMDYLEGIKLVSGEFKDGLDYLSTDELNEFVAYYGLEELVDASEFGEDESLTLEERNSWNKLKNY